MGTLACMYLSYHQGEQKQAIFHLPPLICFYPLHNGAYRPGTYIQKKCFYEQYTALPKLRTALKNCLRKHNTQLYVVATIADAMVMRRRSMEQACVSMLIQGCPNLYSILGAIKKSSVYHQRVKESIESHLYFQINVVSPLVTKKTTVRR